MKRLTAAFFFSPVVACCAEFTIEVEPGIWGAAPDAEMQALAHSAASEILSHTGTQFVPTIILRWREESPLTAHEPDKDGRISLFLTLQDRFWAQGAFQIGHEIVHTLAQHSGESRAEIQAGGHPNLWFEESLCEVGSLYVLENLSITWQNHPPFPAWTTYAPEFSRYAKARKERPGATLPTGVDFPSWFVANHAKLRQNGTNREANSIVGARLLPIFQNDPSFWEALCYLNRSPHPEGETLKNYLAHWHSTAPDRFRPTIVYIAAIFGLAL